MGRMDETAKSRTERGCQNIALIGFMATGKSTVGRRLAESLHWEFVDTDEEIENVSGLSIEEMFLRHGETRFRSEENLLLKRLSKVRDCVIATGGGMVVSEENWRLLAQYALIICLYAPLTQVLERVGDRSSRPLLKGPREKLDSLWLARQSVYNRADIIVDTSNRDVDEVVAGILVKLQARGQEFGILAQMDRESQAWVRRNLSGGIE